MIVDLRIHPIQVVWRLREKYGDGLTLGFLFHNYVPQDWSKITNHRMTVPIADVTAAWLNDKLVGLSENENFSLESNIWFQDQTIGHIPMADFGMSDPVSVWQRTVERSLANRLYSRELIEQFMLFHSGRSLHGYSTELIPEQGFTKFLAICFFGPR